MKVLVLGAGLIGKAIAVDLNTRYDVTSADIQLNALEQLSKTHKIKTKQADFNDKKVLKNLIQPFDLVVSAVPGFMGFSLLQQIIENKKNCVDISFFPENALELDTLAKKNNVIVIVDCGVAPGLCNILAGYHHSISKLNKYECLVGGLPMVREWPYEYKAVFSPIDVIEEYTRPARYIENGKQIVREALSDPEFIYFKDIGTLESFNTDGLRTLADTMPEVLNMKEKTLRFPGHIELMRVLRETGFFDKNKININGQNISPIELTSKLLFLKWKMNEDEEDFTVMRVMLENEVEHIIYTLLDRKDNKNNISSMARTTAFTCTGAAELILKGLYNWKGISPPEYIGKDHECFEYIIQHLTKKNIILTKEIKQLKEYTTN